MWPRLARAGLVALCLALPSAVPAAVFVVDDVADPLPVTGTLTLRQAITAANAIAGPHQILFSIPGPGVQLIQPTAPLPPLTANGTWINGFSQPGAAPGAFPPATATILVQLDGATAGASHGLVVLASSCRIEGLSVTGFQYDGIRIEGTPGTGTRSNVVYANFVGVNPAGTAGKGNGTNPTGGVWAGVDVLCPPTPLPVVLTCTDNRVLNNLVSGNFRCGVEISSCPPSDCWGNFVTDNFIGTDVTGMTPLPNAGSGVVLAEGTHDNWIQQNVISANGANGVDVTGNYFTTPPAHTEHNHFYSNLVGVAVDGVTPLGNLARGVSLGIFEASTFLAGFARANDFAANVVAWNGNSGFVVWEHPLTVTNADSNLFAMNSVHDNVPLGVDLGADGPTPNDPGDLDTGANEQLNTPLILNATYFVGGTTAVGGVVGPGCAVYVYKAKVNPAGFYEGEQFLSGVIPGPGGMWGITTNALMVGDWVTALAVDGSAALPYANTSEFAPAIPVVGGAGVEGGEPLAFGIAPDGANPFHRVAAFRCRIPAAAEARLRVFDAAGKLVRDVFAGRLGAGEHVLLWDGRDGHGREAPPGVYFADFSAGEQRSGRRVVKR